MLRGYVLRGSMLRGSMLRGSMLLRVDSLAWWWSRLRGSMLRGSVFARIYVARVYVVARRFCRCSLVDGRFEVEVWTKSRRHSRRRENMFNHMCSLHYTLLD